MNEFTGVEATWAEFLTRIATCMRNGQRYVIRDVDGREITEAEGKSIVKERPVEVAPTAW